MPSPRRLFTTTYLALALGAPAVLLGQGKPPEAKRVGPQAAQLVDERPATDVRNDVRSLLSKYPPTLGRVLKLDPTLMLNNDYLAPYPDLLAFINRHPEVARDPNYYLDFVSIEQRDPPRSPADERDLRAIGVWQDMFTAVMVFAGFVTAALAVAWLIRYAVSHRRWLRTFRAQIDLQNRVLERFGSSQELLTYLQSPGIAASLLAMPPTIDVPVPAAAPLGRILWAVQAGVVLVCAGVGLLIGKRWVPASEMLVFPGLLALSLGAGFVLAAAASYVISQRLGLLATRTARSAPATSGL